MTDQERIKMLEDWVARLEGELAGVKHQLAQYDQEAVGGRNLRRMQHDLFTQQLYSVVTKEQIRQWIEEAAQTAAEKYAERYVNTDRLQRWMHDTVTVLFKQEGTQWVVREIVAKMASQYVIAPKDGQK